jgi:hypothetical protein
MRWLAGFGLGVVVPLLLSEFLDWCPWLARRLVHRAAWRLPDPDRARYQEEWLAELGQVPGKLAPLTMALGIAARAGRLGRVLQGRPVLPGRAWGFVLAVAAAATVVVGVLVPAAMQQLAGDWRGVVLWPLGYAGLLVLGERLVVRVPLGRREVAVGMAEGVIVLGVVFIPAPLLVLATALGVGVSQWLVESRPVKRLFNVPQYVLAVGAAVLASAALLRLVQGSAVVGIQVGSSSTVHWTVTVLWAVGMAVFFLVNHTLVSVVVSLSTGQRLGQTWAKPASGAAADWAASTACGLVIAALLVHDPALLWLLVIPVALTLGPWRRRRERAGRAAG